MSGPPAFDDDRDLEGITSDRIHHLVLYAKATGGTVGLVFTIPDLATRLLVDRLVELVRLYAGAAAQVNNQTLSEHLSGVLRMLELNRLEE